MKTGLKAQMSVESQERQLRAAALQAYLDRKMEKERQAQQDKMRAEDISRQTAIDERNRADEARKEEYQRGWQEKTYGEAKADRERAFEYGKERDIKGDTMEERRLTAEQQRYEAGRTDRANERSTAANTALAQQQLSDAQTERDRVRKEYDSGLASEEDMQKAEKDYNDAKNELKSAYMANAGRTSGQPADPQTVGAQPAIPSQDTAPKTAAMATAEQATTAAPQPGETYSQWAQRKNAEGQAERIAGSSMGDRDPVMAEPKPAGPYQRSAEEQALFDAMQVNEMDLLADPLVDRLGEHKRLSEKDKIATVASLDYNPKKPIDTSLLPSPRIAQPQMAIPGGKPADVAKAVGDAVTATPEGALKQEVQKNVLTRQQKIERQKIDDAVASGRLTYDKAAVLAAKAGLSDDANAYRNAALEETKTQEDREKRKSDFEFEKQKRQQEFLLQKQKEQQDAQIKKDEASPSGQLQKQKLQGEVKAQKASDIIAKIGGVDKNDLRGIMDIAREAKESGLDIDPAVREAFQKAAGDKLKTDLKEALYAERKTRKKKGERGKMRSLLLWGNPLTAMKNQEMLQNRDRNEEDEAVAKNKQILKYILGESNNMGK